MHIAKIFTNGHSQAIRLPKECRFKDSEVYVKKFDDIVLLIPKNSPWKPMLSGLEEISADFPVDRAQPIAQVREELLR